MELRGNPEDIHDFYLAASPIVKTVLK